MALLVSLSRLCSADCYVLGIVVLLVRGSPLLLHLLFLGLEEDGFVARPRQPSRLPKTFGRAASIVPELRAASRSSDKLVSLL